MSEKRCVVTGLGMICALGENVDECWNAVLDGRSGIKEVTSINTDNCYSKMGAEVSVRSEQLSGEDYDRSSLLCIRAADEALADAGYCISRDNAARTGVIVGSCVGGADSIDKYFSGDFKEPKSRKNGVLKMPASAIAGNIAKHTGASGITANIVNACAAGTIGISYACDLIRAGKGDVFIAGGTDSFSSLAFSGFHALHALAPDACSPFNHSDGITLGEGAGILIIESYEHAAARGARIYCEILGSGVSSDAHHITAPRPDGQGQMNAIRKAVETSGLSFDDIDYINAHGTGTAKNDEAEFLSIHTLFDGNDHLSVSSTKSMTGHCLGAAGAIEAVFTVKAVCDDVVPPTIGYTGKDIKALSEKAGNIDFVPDIKRNKTVNYAMSNSFAFGGNNAGVVFSKKPREMPIVNEKQPIYITGIGAVLGNSFTENGIRKNITAEDFDEHNIKASFYRKLDRFSQLQLISGMKALKNAGITVDETNENDIGIVIGTADGPMTEITDFQKRVIERGTANGSAFSFPNTVYNAAGGYFSIFSGIKGYNVTLANSVQAGLQSLCYGADILKSGKANIVAASGTDENTDIYGELYGELGLFKDNKPYSFADNGFTLGEGSVTIIAETARSANKRGAKKYAEIAGYASAHKSAPFGDIVGTKSALKRAILAACADAGITPDEIDAVSGFANGDMTVDSIEASAYRNIFSRDIPIFSIKEVIGEARAAASAAQTAYAALLLSQKNDITMRAFRLRSNDFCDVDINTESFRYVLVTAFGADGTYSAVVLKKVTEVQLGE